jgi:hypothetical protein
LSSSHAQSLFGSTNCTMTSLMNLAYLARQTAPLLLVGYEKQILLIRMRKMCNLPQHDIWQI